MTYIFFLTTKFGSDYNQSSSNSFPFNQAAVQVPQQVFAPREYQLLYSNEPKNQNTDGNDRTNTSLLPQVRGLVYFETSRQSSDHLSTVQKPALDETKDTKTQEKARIQSQLINFPVIWRICNVEGWFKIWRQIRDNYLYQEKPFDRLHAWIDMISRACYEDEKTVIWRGSSFEIKKGEFIASYRELGQYWGWSKDKVIDFFTSLKTETMIQTVRKGKTTLISITNFERFQSTATVKETVKATDKRQLSDSHFHRISQLNNSNGVTQNRFFNTNEEERKEIKKGSLSEKSREPEAEPVKVRAKAKLVI